MITLLLVIIAAALGFFAGVKHSDKVNAVKDALKK